MKYYPTSAPKNHRAELPAKSVNKAKNLSDEKELTDSWVALAKTDDGNLEGIIEVRCWMSRSKTASVVYASIWAYDRKNDRIYSGHGRAGGSGCDRTSTAVDVAITSAGITLFGPPYNRLQPDPAQYEHIDKSTSIAGVGPGAIKLAMSAIANALGYPETFIV